MKYKFKEGTEMKLEKKKETAMKWEKPVLVDLSMAQFQASCGIGNAVAMSICGPAGSSPGGACRTGSGV